MLLIDRWALTPDHFPLITLHTFSGVSGKLHYTDFHGLPGSVKRDLEPFRHKEPLMVDLKLGGLRRWEDAAWPQAALSKVDQ
jgi:hypothetical protein